MPDATPTTLRLPSEAFVGIKALVDLGERPVQMLGQLQANQPLDLSIAQLLKRLASEFQCDHDTLQRVFMHVLLPLNSMRRNLGGESSAFLEALDRTVLDKAPEDWLERNRALWKRIVTYLPPLFAPDNFFSQVSKALDLLTERPAMFQSARLLTDLRPVFDESHSKTLAVLHSNTLVLNYWDGEGTHTLHVTMDKEDLQVLEEQLKRAREKMGVTQQEASGRDAVLVVYGGSQQS